MKVRPLTGVVSPTAAEVRAARKAVGLTAKEAAMLVYLCTATWKAAEAKGAGYRAMHPAIAELFAIKTGLKSCDEVIKKPAN